MIITDEQKIEMLLLAGFSYDGKNFNYNDIQINYQVDVQCKTSLDFLEMYLKCIKRLHDYKNQEQRSMIDEDQAYSVVYESIKPYLSNMMSEIQALDTPLRRYLDLQITTIHRIGLQKPYDDLEKDQKPYKALIDEGY